MNKKTKHDPLGEHYSKHKSKAKVATKGKEDLVQRPIVLVGLMGTGKTTVGRRLANRLDLPFLDSDEEIEKAAQMSVAEIFETLGEAEFRAGERRVIARLLNKEPVVLATGGGAFINQETQKLIRKKAISIWLDAPIDILVKRTAKKDTRPLLKAGDPKTILTRLAEQRNPVYRKADIHIRSSVGPHDRVVARILHSLALCS